MLEACNNTEPLRKLSGQPEMKQHLVGKTCEVTPGSVLTYEDYVSLDHWSTSIIPLTRAELKKLKPKPLGPDEDMFEYYGVDDCMAHLFLGNRNRLSLGDVESMIKENRGFRRLRHLPLLQFINVYSRHEHSHMLSVAKLRRKCDCCGKTEIMFDHPPVNPAIDALFLKKREAGLGCRLKQCGSCFNALYCSKECQRKDWPQHRLVCNVCQ